MTNTAQDMANAKETISKEIQCLQKLEELLGEQPLSAVLDILQNTQGRIIFTGMGKSGIIAQKIVASLASTGTPAFFIHPAEASHGDLGMITPEDTVVAISNSGESKELADVLNYCKRFDIKLIGLTKNPQSTLAKNVDFVLALPVTPEADPLGLAPTSSTTATLVLGDVLTVALMARKKFTKTDFQMRHPGGKLGAVLQTVKDVMHSGAEMPLLPQDAPVSAILIEIPSGSASGVTGNASTKSTFLANVLCKDGRLTGIFTDGDLRRNMSPELFHKTGVDIMTVNPKQVPPDMMAAEALRIMNAKKITTLFVTQNEKPLGVVHVHDLLKLGL